MIYKIIFQSICYFTIATEMRFNELKHKKKMLRRKSKHSKKSKKLTKSTDFKKLFSKPTAGYLQS